MFGYDYDHPGRNTEEYVQILTGLLAGEPVDLDGADWTAHTGGRAVPPPHPVPVLVSALGRRLLRVAGAIADGTVLWMAPAKAIESHVVPTITAAAADAGRPPPRIVAGLPVAVHDDEADARSAAVTYSTVYAGMANYQRILEIGGAPARPTPPSSATRPPCARSCSRSSTPAPPTSGPRPSPSATTARPLCVGLASS